jgi:hypothetical protein
MLSSHEKFALNRIKAFFGYHGIEAVFEDDSDLLWFIVRDAFIAPEGMTQTIDQAKQLVRALEKKKMLERRVSRGDAPDMLTISAAA